MNIDVTTGVDFKDFVWLYLTVNRFDYIVLHKWISGLGSPPLRLDRLDAMLRECKIYEDGTTIAYARGLLRPLIRPVHICPEEWQERSQWRGRWSCRLPETARVVVYNPVAAQDLTLVFDTLTLKPHQHWELSVRSGSREIATWQVQPGDYRRYVSTCFRLPAGLQELTLKSGIGSVEGDKGSTRGLHSRGHADVLKIARISLYHSSDTEAVEAVAQAHTDQARQDTIAR